MSCYLRCSVVLVLFTSMALVARLEAIRTVALSDEQAPGVSGDVKWTGFSAPVLSDTGQVAFQAGLSGSAVTGETNSSIWVH